MNRIGLAFNPTQPAATDLLDRAEAWCRTHQVDHWTVRAGEGPYDPDDLATTDAVVVLGGDGTFLRAAHAIANTELPVLGVNSGKVGFLSKVEGDALEHVFSQLVSGDYDLEPRLTIEARVIDADGRAAAGTHVALNEAAVVRGGHVQVMRVIVDVGDSRMATYTCDGIVVASPTGSTGYSFSAGGPILEPTSRALVVTPIAAYLTPLRSSVVGPQHVVRATIEAAHDCLVSIDGREDLPLTVGDTVEVRAREKPIHFIQPRGVLPFWDLLRQKATLLPG